jgi:CRISPR-associated protein Cas5d
VEICAPIQTIRYATNYGGPLRHPKNFAGGTGYQLYSTILIDVIYKIHAIARESGRPPEATNHLHAVQELFERRLRQGKLYRTPCLGWSEFTPSYFGPIRETTAACRDLSMEIPSMLHRVFDHPQEGNYSPEYRQGVKIKEGVLRFAE